MKDNDNNENCTSLERMKDNKSNENHTSLEKMKYIKIEDQFNLKLT